MAIRKTVSKKKVSKKKVVKKLTAKKKDLRKLQCVVTIQIEDGSMTKVGLREFVREAIIEAGFSSDDVFNHNNIKRFAVRVLTDK